MGFAQKALAAACAISVGISRNEPKQVYTVACTEMTKNKKIEILRAAHVVELSWASIVIIFSFKSLHLGFRALP